MGIEMSVGMLIFTYAILFVAGLSMGAVGVGSWWLYHEYKKIFSNLKNIKVEIRDDGSL